MWIALLSSLDGIEGVHKHISGGSSETSSEHGLGGRIDVVSKPVSIRRRF